MGSLLGRFRNRLPGSLSERIRALFATFVVVVASLTALGLFSATPPVFPHSVVVLASLAVIAVYAWQQYRRGGLPVWADAVPIAAVFAAGWGLGNAGGVFGLLFVLLYARALYGSAARVAANAIAFYLAYQGVIVATVGWDDLASVSTLTTAVAVAFTAGLMWLLRDVARTHERATEREAVLARVASQLQRVETREQAVEVAMDGVMELLAGVDEAGVALWRGDDHVLRATRINNEYPDDAPIEIHLSVLPDDVKATLAIGEPFVLDPAVAARVVEVLGSGQHYDWTLVVPLRHGPTLSGALTVSTHEELPRDVAGSLGRLAADVGLTLDRAEIGARRADTERELRQSEQRFRSLAEHVSEGLYQMTLEPTPRFEFVNPAMERMTGFPAERWLDDPDLTLERVHPDDRDTVLRSRTDPDSVQWPLECRWNHPDLGWRWLSVRETVLHGPGGAPHHTMGMLSDITARKEQEQALRGALEAERHVSEELRRLDEMKTTFLQAVSHELRTPLTAISGFAKTLNRNMATLDDAKVETILDRLEFNADKLERMLMDLLDLSRLASSTIEPERAPTDLAALCRAVVDQIEADTHPVTVPDAPLVVEVDAAKVERILENLVRNAIKHTEPGTPIAVEVRRDEDGDGAILTVTDRGRGIPANLHRSVFDPFVQGPQSASAPQPGTGIGLALVARFAELHGGRAWVEDAEGGGARFSVWLPAAVVRVGGSASAAGGRGGADGHTAR